jgi:hypothetical protein
MDKKDRKAAVGDLIQRFVKSHPAFSANPLGDWQDFVGEQTARHSQPQSLKKKVLTVTAYDSIWKHHLDLNREAIINNINRGHSEPLVEKMVVRVGEIPKEAPVLNPDHKLLDKLGSKRRRAPRKKRPPLHPLTDEEKALLKKLPDPELRKMGKRLLQLLPEDKEVGEER